MLHAPYREESKWVSNASDVHTISTQCCCLWITRSTPHFVCAAVGFMLAELTKGMLAADANRERPFPGSFNPTILES